VDPGEPAPDEVLAALDSAAGWDTARVRRPALELGCLDGVMTGIRQRRRTRPLDTEPLPRLWLAAMAELGEPVDLGVLLPRFEPEV
jgi:hypothetical protein